MYVFCEKERSETQEVSTRQAGPARSHDTWEQSRQALFLPARQWDGKDDFRSSEHRHQQPLPFLTELNSDPHGKALLSGAVMGLSVGSRWLSCDSQKGFWLFATARRELAATNACFTFSPGFMTGCRVPVLCLSVLMYCFRIIPQQQVKRLHCKHTQTAVSFHMFLLISNSVLIIFFPLLQGYTVLREKK